MKLSTYEDWKHCITVSCGIPLTLDYVEKRIDELKDPNDFGTQKFKKTWGDEHREQIISWFEKAKAELST